MSAAEEKGEKDSIPLDTAEALKELERKFSASTRHSAELQDYQGRFAEFLRDSIRSGLEAGAEPRSISVLLDNVSVHGEGADALYTETVWSMLTKPFHLPSLIKSKVHPRAKLILNSIQVAADPGEMVLILGRPGSGCTSYLRTVAQDVKGFTKVEGYQSFSGIDPKRFSHEYLAESIYMPEDDVHIPHLTVRETFDFAANCRTPAKSARKGSRKDAVNNSVEAVIALLGLGPAANTIVGNEFVRGVSGGERKRVSIGEVLLSRGVISCQDNSTRGLDSSTALQYGQSMRITTDLLGMTNFFSLYQCGEQLYDLFDRVAVLFEGEQIYYGPRDKAASYFYDMGYERMDRQTSADFLVSITDPKSRRVRKGFEDKVPVTPAQFARYFRESSSGKALQGEIDSKKKNYGEYAEENAAAFKSSVNKDRAKLTRSKSPYIVSFSMMLRYCFIRRIRILKNDLTQFIALLSLLWMGFIVGSLFYKTPADQSGFFSRGGVIFFGLLVSSFLSMAEIPMAFAQRPILVRHRRFGICRPSADFLADTVVSVPSQILQILVLNLPLYFLSGLEYKADNFFFYLLFVFITTFGMRMAFRLIAQACSRDSYGSMFAGMYVLTVGIYAGYTFPRPVMYPWNRWISYANPISFGFEALMASEFKRLYVPCTQFIPSGGQYDSLPIANKVCNSQGSQAGDSQVSGPAYLMSQFEYTYSHSWRNFGFILAYGFAYGIAALILSEYQKDFTEKGNVLVYNRSKAAKEFLERDNAKLSDEEKLKEYEAKRKDEEKLLGGEGDAVLEANEDIFTWRDLCYDVPIGKGEYRRLLDHVTAFVQPGKLTALMGESGAGKTTLLNVLAQRVSSGFVYGDMLVNGKPLPISFQRQTGYVQQLDTHLDSATVREAVEFSGFLRLPRSMSHEDKKAHIDDVLTLLELDDCSEALVGEIGTGLNVELRKRLSIAVELVAKPDLLIFLDEPSSGLDSQSSYNIIVLLTKLAAHGQAVLTTIHQPSGQLFNLFDRLLLLKKGGKVVYFGDTGDNSMTVIDYFERSGGRKAHENENPAEYVLDVIGAGAGATAQEDWAQIWHNSPEFKKVSEQIQDFEESFRDKVPQAEKEEGAHDKYAASYWSQIYLVTERALVNYWRDTYYILAKLLLGAFSGLYIGFSTWKAKESELGLREKLFAVFMAVSVTAALSQQLTPRVIHFRDIFEVREQHSRTYAWWVLLLAVVLVEQPWNILTATIYFACSYFTTGLPVRYTQSGYFYLMLLLYYTYWPSLSTLVSILSPTAEAGSIIFSILFSTSIAFCGALQPPQQMPYFWRIWLNRLVPHSYFMDGLLSAAVHNQPIRCLDSELLPVVPPAGQTCEQYLGPFAQAAGGYVTEFMNSNGDQQCGYCTYSVADTYLTPLRFSWSHRWRNFGFAWAYIVFNWAIMFIVAYALRYGDWNKGKRQKMLKGGAAPDVKGISG